MFGLMDCLVFGGHLECLIWVFTNVSSVLFDTAGHLSFRYASYYDFRAAWSLFGSFLLLYIVVDKCYIRLARTHMKFHTFTKSSQKNMILQ